MNPKNTKTLVVGHRNPDMDAIASAVGYAWLLGEETHQAGCLGPVNAQTTYALQRFKFEAPPVIPDARPHVADVTETVEPLRPDVTLQTACQRIARHQHLLPVIDENGIPVGMVSGAGLFRHLVDVFENPQQLAQRLSQPVSGVVEVGDLTLRAADNISDIVNRVLRSEQDEFIVVDDRYIGLCRKSALLAPPRRRVILVDHNEVAQSVPGLEETELVEILDHHRLNALPTITPIRLHIEPVGSCSTLVAEQAAEKGVEFPPAIAGLLLCGILSDTLGFRSPTTTPRDETAAQRLAQRANVNIEQLTVELLNAGAGLAARTPESIVSADLKTYPVGDKQIGIAQVEITNFNELIDHLGGLRSTLQQLAANQKLALAVLMVTNIVSGDSRLITAGQNRDLPYTRLPDGTYDAPGVVSRKKQLLPAVLAAMSE